MWEWLELDMVILTCIITVSMATKYTILILVEFLAVRIITELMAKPTVYSDILFLKLMMFYSCCTS